MGIFAETSFLFAIYRFQNNSVAAAEIFALLPHGSPLSPLVIFEFENSLRLQVGLFQVDRSKGFPERIAEKARADFHSDLDAGFWKVAPLDWPQVLAEAEKLSSRHTAAGSHRAMDLLHVATARHLGSKTFLTFDERQSKLAKNAGLKTPLPVR